MSVFIISQVSKRCGALSQLHNEILASVCQKKKLRISINSVQIITPQMKFKQNFSPKTVTSGIGIGADQKSGHDSG